MLILTPDWDALFRVKALNAFIYQLRHAETNEIG
jgi:hypothetical protein